MPLSPSVFQRIIQSVFLVLCLHTGWRFYLFVLWATGSSPHFVPRPPSVEAFLPIAALMSLRRLLQTGAWDMVHPAGLSIFLAAIVTALVLRKGFCGYVCPVGLVSGLLNTLGRRLGLSRVPGPWVARLLAAPKYLGLGFFLFTIFIGMDLNSLEQFANAPYNYVADARMLNFFLHPSRTTIMILGVLLGAGDSPAQLLVPLPLPLRRPAWPVQLAEPHARAPRRGDLRELRALHRGLPGMHPGAGPQACAVARVPGLHALPGSLPRGRLHHRAHGWQNHSALGSRHGRRGRHARGVVAGPGSGAVAPERAHAHAAAVLSDVSRVEIPEQAAQDFGHTGRGKAFGHGSGPG